MTSITPPSLHASLLNRWQHGFPLCDQPFDTLAGELGCRPEQVLAAYAELQAQGSFSRIAGLFSPAAGGASTLAAMRVSAERLDEVAARVSAEPGVNHNYQREGRHNLWFVLNAANAGQLETRLAALEQACGLPALRLPMRRAFHIDLGFNLDAASQPTAAPAPPRPAAAGWRRIPPPLRPLAALVEQGLPLLPRPYEHWARQAGLAPQAVLSTLRHWLKAGTLRRFGVVVRHHELGFTANAMAVFEVSPLRRFACGQALARAPGLTLVYERLPAPGWPYTLYCMVHGRHRGEALQQLHEAMAQAGLMDCPHEVLFSLRRFKQTGPRRFAPPLPFPFHAQEVSHVLP